MFFCDSKIVTGNTNKNYPIKEITGNSEFKYNYLKHHDNYEPSHFG
jgi:hypothetical protein